MLHALLLSRAIPESMATATLPTYLEKAGANLENERVVHFGDALAEYRAFQEGSSLLVPLLGNSTLRVTGADRLDFVHGQLSNDVKRLENNQANTSLLLNHKGHALAHLRVLRRADDLLLVVEGNAGEFVRQQLETHIIFDQVELEPLTLTTLTLQGEAAAQLVEEVVGVVPEPNTFLPFGDGGVVVPVKRSVSGGYDLHIPVEDAAALFDTLKEAGAVPAGEEALGTARVLAGIPAVETEAGEGVLPQEAGLEYAVSYTKGCYLGQEIMARIEARGNLRRSLQGLLMADTPKTDERDIFADGKKVGRLGTVAHHPELGVIGLAVLRKDLDGVGLEVAGVSAQVTPLPFAG